MEIILTLGVYVVTLAITESDGPWGTFARFRQLKWVEDFGLFNCFLCMAFWVSLALCAAFWRLDLVLLPWGGSVVLYSLITAYKAKQ